MTCPRCRTPYEDSRGRCPRCGATNRKAHGTYQTSTVLISSGGSDRVYRSVEEVPPPAGRVEPDDEPVHPDPMPRDVPRFEVRDAATKHPFQQRIETLTAAVHEMGAGGVPAFVIDDRVMIPGAQPHDLFEKVMNKLGVESVESPDDAAGASA